MSFWKSLGKFIGGNIPVVGGLVDNVLSSLFTSKANKRSIQHQYDMYNRQRQDSLQDWSTQVAYNDPQAQMKRLEDANLNPNLIYKGGATMEAPAVRSASPSAVQQQVPQFQLGGAFAMMYDLAKKLAETNNLKALNENIQARTKSTDQTREQQKELFPYTLEGQELEMRKREQDLKIQNREHDYRVLESVERILNDRKKRELMAEEIEATKQQILNSIKGRQMTSAQIMQVGATINNLNESNKLLRSQTAGQDITNDGRKLTNQLLQVELGHYGNFGKQLIFKALDVAGNVFGGRTGAGRYMQQGTKPIKRVTTYYP